MTNVNTETEPNLNYDQQTTNTKLDNDSIVNSQHEIEMNLRNEQAKWK